MSKLKSYKFSDLYDMSSGISSKPEQAGHGFPFVSFNSVFNNQFLPESLPDLMDTSEKERETYSIKEGDIFLTRTSETLNELGMSSVAVKEIPNATYSGFLKRLRPKQKDISYHKFMAFFLRSKPFRKIMNNNAIMTLRASLNEQIFSYLDLLLPEYSEQVKIGDYLYLLNQKIDLNNKINAELEAMAKLIYDYWFVQFDFPDANDNPYKSSGGRMVDNEVLKYEIPEGWKVEPVGVHLNIYDSSRIPMSRKERDEKQGSYPYFGATGVMDYVNDYIYEGDYILVAEDGSIMDENGMPIVQFIWGKTWVNNHAHVMQAKNKSQNEFYFQTLKRIPVVLIKTGSIQLKINQANLMSYKLLVPNDDLVNKYSILFGKVREKLKSGSEETKKLIELRDWLLPMLMNGQVTVKDV
jgi:type I restriction enzyme S subunit